MEDELSNQIHNLSNSEKIRFAKLLKTNNVFLNGLSHKEGKKRAWLYQQGVVIREEVVETGMLLVVFWSAQQKAQFFSI